MSYASHTPKHPIESEWDVVVIGTGMGGSTIGFALARFGWRVLFLEKGLFLDGNSYSNSGSWLTNNAEERLRHGWWPKQIQGSTNFGKRDFFAPLGCGSGGTTNLFAAQLERLIADDLIPKRNYLDIPETSMPEAWPITYRELIPFYRKAELLYRVCGTPDPLNVDTEASLREPPPLSSRDQYLYDSLCSLDLHPYRSHVAFEYVPDCQECPGEICPHACRNDARRSCLLPALEQFGAKIITQCEVLNLVANSSKVTRIRCSWNTTELSLSARIVVLAAGALMTPALLLKSISSDWPNGVANSSDQVGRNLMFHASDFFVVSTRGNKATLGPKKALSINDFYFCEGKKLGTVQSVNRVAVNSGEFAGAAPFATILEDLPYFHNRVIADARAKNGMRFEYHYSDELRTRNNFFRRRITETLSGRHRILLLSGDNNINYGHACGTCRFGNDPLSAVLDRNNLAHDVENLYIVDGSFFPSSGGTNPSLTIAANALRVSEVINARLSSGFS